MKRHREFVAIRVLCFALLVAAIEIPASRAAQGPDLKPEKNRLEVAIAAYRPALFADHFGQ